jgi:ABC-type multidrug transport system fused ATPase/permease subunit
MSYVGQSRDGGGTCRFGGRQITPALVYLTAGLLIASHHAVSAGTIVAFTTLQTRLYFPIGQLLQVSVELRSSLALFDRVFAYLDVVPDIVAAPDAVDLPVAEAGGRAALRDVCFRYPVSQRTPCRASEPGRRGNPGRGNPPVQRPQPPSRRVHVHARGRSAAAARQPPRPLVRRSPLVRRLRRGGDRLR